MLRNFSKFFYMIQLGFRYIRIYKKSYFHPFKSLKAKHTQLSCDRQAYSNAVLKHLNIGVKLIGEVPKEDHILYAINHRSLLDIIVMEHIFSQAGKSGVWIAKQELFDAFYGDFFKYSGCISVDVENKRGLMKFFKEIKFKLAKISNLNIYIFPEGERHKKEGVTKFQAGAINIAKTNNLITHPVFIDDALEKVFKEAPYKEKKIIQVHIGSAISHANLEQEYIHFMDAIKGESK